MVPNRFPTLASTRRVALIGEAPGKDEMVRGEPFVGASGRFLAALLSRAGIARDACFLGNVSQWQPAGNKIASFSWTGPEITEGLAQLKEDLQTFQPNIVVLLGNVPLKAAKDPTTSHPLVPNSFRYKNSQWRGSLFVPTDGPMKGFKCLSTYHPAYVLRDYSACPLLQFDLKKAVRESEFPAYSPPKRRLDIDLTETQILNELHRVQQERLLTAMDIEGGLGTMSCISFANDPHRAFIVPFVTRTGAPATGDTPAVWRALSNLLEDPLVPKVLQNSLYDRFVLHYGYGIRVNGVVEDTMLKHWELYSELEKSLGVQCSIYTDEPYYKGERSAQDDKTFYEYCCKDSAVTLEISQKLDTLLRGVSLDHYKLNVSLLDPLLYMELRGIRYDVLGAAARRRELQEKLYEEQAKLNGLVGLHLSAMSKAWTSARDLMAFKKVPLRVGDWHGIARNAKKSHWTEAQALVELVHQPNPTLSTLGHVETLLETGMNVDSPKQFTHYLYNVLRLPPQYKQTNDEKEPSLTADYEALLRLAKLLSKSEDHHALSVIQHAIEIRSLGTRAGMLGISADGDGRIRCGYNIVGTETGRVTCYKSPTGSGYNLQTIPKYDRDLFLSDDDHWFFQCDLAGADGWTVAAYCKMLGDPTMLDDYLAGLKPAKILCLMLRGVQVDFKDREALREASRKVSGDDWDYFAMKRVQHGASYLEGGPTISNNIFKDSEGKSYILPSECKKMRDSFFFARYPGIRKWHDWVGRRLRETSSLTAASGQRRQFFGRPDEIITEAVAFEPQANTTYATNLAMYRLWTDKENRRDSGMDNVGTSSILRIEPLHQVHDALCGQFKKSDTSWATTRIKSYFDNTLVIGGIPIVIPFEGGYGPSWGKLGTKYGGGEI